MPLEQPTRSRRSVLPLSKRLRLALVLGAAALAALVWIAILHAGTALVVEEPLASPDAIISLASHEWERLPETIRLAHRHPGAQVLLTLPPEINDTTATSADTGCGISRETGSTKNGCTSCPSRSRAPSAKRPRRRSGPGTHISEA